jgi:hypothetical protein
MILAVWFMARVHELYIIPGKVNASGFVNTVVRELFLSTIAHMWPGRVKDTGVFGSRVEWVALWLPFG